MSLTVFASILHAAASNLDDDSLRAVLRYTGRIAFVLLLVVFAARPLQQLFRRPWSAWLLRNRRQLGVAFAGIHMGHLVLIGIRVSQSPDLELTDILSLSGAVVYAVILAMLVTSFQRPAQMIGRRSWTLMHTIGIYILFIGFSVSQLPSPPAEYEAANLVLLTLAAAALALRVLAFIRARQRPLPQ